MGIGIRLLPPSEEDTAAAARVKFASKFHKNQKEKRALITSSSIFSSTSVSTTKQFELAGKRRKINAAAASNLLVGGYKPSSWAKSACVSGKRKI